MDEICRALSSALCEAGMGCYKIFYEDELTEILPEGAKNRDTLDNAIHALCDGGFIDVKYARGDVFCIAARKRYDAPYAKEEEPERQKAVCAKLSRKSYALFALVAFFGGAAGAFAAALAAF